VNPDLLVIVGPTAVGKTALSLKLAKEFTGEIISGDSMQVYKEMDIGTAKATAQERREIPHHMIDLIYPDTSFSVQEFQQLAERAIWDVYQRGHLPMLVGGTGLYVQSITHGYHMPKVSENRAYRSELINLAEREGNMVLYQRLQEVDSETASRLHPNDRRRIIRALEVYHETGKRFSDQKKRKTSPYNLLWIGLTMPRDLLYDRINQRVDQMIEQGLIQEVKQLKEKGYHDGLTSIQAIGYKEIISYLDGDITLEEAIESIKRGTRKFAKRQLSWFRRIPEIHWFDVMQNPVYTEIQQLVAGKFPRYRE
jgi:tRNA dimethylallyltransferase